MPDGRQELKPAYHHQAIPRVQHQQSSSSISRSSAKIEKIHTKLSGFSKVPPQTVTLGHMIPETSKLGEFLFFAQSTSRGTNTSDRKFRCLRGMADPTYKYCGENPRLAVSIRRNDGLLRRHHQRAVLEVIPGSRSDRLGNSARLPNLARGTYRSFRSDADVRSRRPQPGISRMVDGPPPRVPRTHRRDMRGLPAGTARLGGFCRTCPRVPLNRPPVQGRVSRLRSGL